MNLKTEPPIVAECNTPLMERANDNCRMSTLAGLASFFTIAIVVAISCGVVTWMWDAAVSEWTVICAATVTFLLWSIVPRRWLRHRLTKRLAASLGLFICVSVAWRGVHVYRLSSAMSTIVSQGGHLRLDYDWTDAQFVKTRGGWMIPAKLRDVLGDAWFADVEEVWLGTATDANLSSFDLRPFTSIEFTGAQISDVGMPVIAQQTQLYSLGLSQTAISDQGVFHLEALQNLSELWLMHTEITDESVASLAKLKRLNTLVVTHTKITDAGALRLRQALPRCTVIH